MNRQSSERRAQNGTERKIGRVQFQVAGLDLGEVEDVVDEPKQVVRRRLDRHENCRWSSVRGVSRASSVMPRMAFMGVRISWLTLARNSSLARLAAFAASLASATLPPAALRVNVQIQPLEKA